MNTAIAEYSPTAAALAEIGSRMANVVYDVSTPKGMEAAKKDRAEVRDLRVALEKKRVEIKAPALKRSQEIDSEANRIKAELLKYETPPDNAIKAEEKRIDDINKAKAAAEDKRKADIRERVNELYGNTMLTPTTASALIAGHISDLEAIKVDESFAEFFGEAEENKKAGLVRLRVLHAAAVAHETESERLRKEQVDLIRQRAEQEARDKVERDRIAAENLEALRKREAETAAENERLRKQREAFDAEQAAARIKQREENARIAAQQAEAQRRIDDARRELEAKQAAEHHATAERERKAEEERERNFKPTLDDIVTAIAEHYSVSAEKARVWVVDAVAAA